MRITIDRIEEGFVIAELPNGDIIDIPIALLPDAIEGDVFVIEKDADEADARRKRVLDKMDRLFRD